MPLLTSNVICAMKIFKDYSITDYVVLFVSTLGSVILYIIMLHKHGNTLSEILQITAFFVPLSYLLFQFGHTTSGSINSGTWGKKRNINKAHVAWVITISVCLYLLSLTLTNVSI